MVSACSLPVACTQGQSWPSTVCGRTLVPVVTCHHDCHPARRMGGAYDASGNSYMGPDGGGMYPPSVPAYPAEVSSPCVHDALHDALHACMRASTLTGEMALRLCLGSYHGSKLTAGPQAPAPHAHVPCIPPPHARRNTNAATGMHNCTRPFPRPAPLLRSPCTHLDNKAGEVQQAHQQQQRPQRAAWATLGGAGLRCRPSQPRHPTAAGALRTCRHELGGAEGCAVRSMDMGARRWMPPLTFGRVHAPMHRRFTINSGIIESYQSINCRTKINLVVDRRGSTNCKKNFK